MLTMKQLVDLTAINRQTIHFYLREGVLPPPVTGAGTRNARYSDRHRELLELVRALREEEGLSLESIRDRFESAGFDPALVRRPSRDPARPLPDPAEVAAEPLLETELAGAASVPESMVAEMIAAGAISPLPEDPEGRYAKGVTDVLRAAAALGPMGLPMRSVAQIAIHAARIAWLEVEAMASEATGNTDGAEVLSRNTNARYRRVGDLVSATRRVAVTAALRRLTRVGTRARTFAREAIFRPSELFVSRYGLERVLEETRARARGDERDFEARLEAGRILLGLGRWTEAAEWLADSVALDPKHAEAAAFLGLARALAGPVHAGVAAARRAVELAPESPRAHAFLGVVLAFHAASTTGIGDASTVLLEAFAEVGRSRELKARDSAEILEVLLARGRVLAVLPIEIEAYQAGLMDLREVLRRTDEGGGAEAGFDYPGSQALYRINALYFLGSAAIRDGDVEQGVAWLTECITMDPSSSYAERAYVQVGASGQLTST